MTQSVQPDKCARKLAYATKADAERHSAMPDCRVYECAECGCWHVEAK